MAWTVAPAIILAVLALASKKVWDNYRYSPFNTDPNRAKVMVIGEQFKWNIIYPGPDGEFGRYLIYPKPGDGRWQNPDGSGKPFTHAGVTGPALLPYDQALRACNDYISQHNKLGKDFEDPKGKDDNWVADPGRAMIIPKGRPVEVILGSKDVLHDFFLPNFRVKLDAVPGMRGSVSFQSKVSSTERERATRKMRALDDVAASIKSGKTRDLTVVIGEGAPEHAARQKDRTGWRYADVKNAKPPRAPATIIRDGKPLPNNPQDLDVMLGKLRENDVKEILAYEPAEWDIVCEELCGQGHNTMQGILRIVESDEYDAMKLDQPYRGTMTASVAAQP
jgi:heme/copper-type cytochrome/quinol oxidase subunit 2